MLELSTGGPDGVDHDRDAPGAASLRLILGYSHLGTECCRGRGFGDPGHLLGRDARRVIRHEGTLHGCGAAAPGRFGAYREATQPAAPRR